MRTFHYKSPLSILRHFSGTMNSSIPASLLSKRQMWSAEFNLDFTHAVTGVSGSLIWSLVMRVVLSSKDWFLLSLNLKMRSLWIIKTSSGDGGCHAWTPFCWGMSRSGSQTISFEMLLICRAYNRIVVTSCYNTEHSQHTVSLSYAVVDVNGVARPQQEQDDYAYCRMSMPVRSALGRRRGRQKDLRTHLQDFDHNNMVCAYRSDCTNDDIEAGVGLIASRSVSVPNYWDPKLLKLRHLEWCSH